MKFTLYLTVLVLLFGSLYADEGFSNRQDLYVPISQDMEDSSLYYSPDGEKVVVVASSDEIRIWSIAEQRLVKVFETRGSVYSSEVSRDGRYLLINRSHQGESHIELLDLVTERITTIDEGWEIAECDSPSSLIMDISPDGKYLVYTANIEPLNRIKIWDIAKEEIVGGFSTKDVEIQNILISNHSNFVVTASTKNIVDVWSLKGENFHRFKVDKDYISEFEISDDDKYLLLNDRVIDLATEAEIKYPNYGDDTYLYLSPNSKELISYSEENSTILFWDIETQSVYNMIKNSSAINSIGFSSDRENLMIYLYEDRLKVVDINRSQEIASVDYHQRVALSPDRSSIVSFDKKGDLILSDLKTAKVTTKLSVEGSKPIFSVLMSRDGKYIFSIGFEDAVRLWDVENSKLLTSFKVRGLTGEALLTSNGKYLLLDTYGDTKIWDIEQRKFIKSNFELPEEFKKTVSRDDDLLTSVSHKNSIEIYNIADMQRPIKEFIFGTDGSWIVFDNLNKKFYRGGEKSFPLSATHISPNGGIELSSR